MIRNHIWNEMNRNHIFIELAVVYNLHAALTAPLREPKWIIPRSTIQNCTLMQILIVFDSCKSNHDNRKLIALLF